MLNSLSRCGGLTLLLLLLCIGCHDEATTQAASNAPGDVNRRVEVILRSIMSPPPNIRIEFGQRTPSEQFTGFDNLPVTFIDGTRRMPMQYLISKDNKTLFQMNKYELDTAALKKTMDKIDVKDRPFRGGHDAKVVIVNYDDFECPFCAKMHQTLFPAIQKQYGDKIKIVYRDYPLVSIHPWAMHAAVNANCLAQQSSDAYWSFADAVHGHQPEIMGPQDHPRSQAEQTEEVDKVTVALARQHNLNLNNLQACMAATDHNAIEAEIQEANNIGVNSTPTMFINGIRVGGIMAEEDLRKIIDLALQDAGETPPSAAGTAQQ